MEFSPELPKCSVRLLGAVGSRSIHKYAIRAPHFPPTH